jgi:hypothetical protein
MCRDARPPACSGRARVLGGHGVTRYQRQRASSPACARGARSLRGPCPSLIHARLRLRVDGRGRALCVLLTFTGFEGRACCALTSCMAGLSSKFSRFVWTRTGRGAAGADGSFTRACTAPRAFAGRCSSATPLPISSLHPFGSSWKWMARNIACAPPLTRAGIGTCADLDARCCASRPVSTCKTCLKPSRLCAKRLGGCRLKIRPRHAVLP